MTRSNFWVTKRDAVLFFSDIRRDGYMIACMIDDIPLNDDAGRCCPEAELLPSMLRGINLVFVKMSSSRLTSSYAH